ncbi:DUF1007 family protein [Marimonas sp. MJW-29]|uniref:DUF1007 family protein n=1 Tax=Sulfitobacter sediminis TaxID=3234186 RepID=A0ABV3RGM7_9RHOB
MKPLPALAAALMLATPLGAHPHIFVDTGLELSFDAEGRLTEVKTTWAYDDFYSLLIMEDRGLDPDFDGILTPAEQADLTGFDMNWTEGFNGDLVILQAGRELQLSGPMQATATYEDGRITTTHVRQVISDQTPGTPLELKPYDATYYTAYDITLPVAITGTNACGHRLDVPDIDARLREMRDLLAQLDMDTTPEEEGLPDIGGLLATTVVVTCDMS